MCDLFLKNQFLNVFCFCTFFNSTAKYRKQSKLKKTKVASLPYTPIDCCIQTVKIYCTKLRTDLK